MAKRKVGGAWYNPMSWFGSSQPSLPGYTPIGAPSVSAGPSWFRTNFNNIALGLFMVVFITTIFGVIIWVLTKEKKHDSGGGGSATPSGGAVDPGMSNRPGRVDIAAINQGPSAGQAIIYFSKAEATGATCDSCEVEFKTTMTYTGAYPSNPEPLTKVTTVPLSAGIVNITYTPESPRGSDSLPTQVQIDVTATVINVITGVRGGPVSKSTQLPYIG